MKISVILCTHNRCRSLAEALESIAASTHPEVIEWEVLVVDNNSSDLTCQVVESFCHRPRSRFRYLFEPRPGKSHALNAGVREARGDILAFVDDDVTVEPTWLQNLTSPLKFGEWAGVGGRILPARAFSPPRWLSLESKYALAPLAIFDLGKVAHELNESPFGTNMAFHKRMFEKYGGFRTDLGPCPGNEIRNMAFHKRMFEKYGGFRADLSPFPCSEIRNGEDTEFGNRLLSKGERFRYEPSAVVYHSVPEERVQQKYFLAWWFDKARGDVRTFEVPPDVKWFVGGIPLFFFRRLAVWALRWMVAVEPSRRFSCKINVLTQVGAIVELCRRSCDARRQ